MLNRWVLSRDRKTAMEGAEVTSSVRLFQTRAAATGKARSPTVECRVRLTISDEDELERSCCRALTSATWQSSSIILCRCRPVKTLVHEDCIFKCNPLWSLQPVQLMQGRSDVLELRRGKNKPSLTADVTRDVMKRRPVSHCRSPKTDPKSSFFANRTPLIRWTGAIQVWLF